MIKALQLRLGNYIYSPYHGKKMQVEEVSNKFLILDDGLRLKVWFNEYEFEGISLTPEALEDFGFVCMNNMSTLFRKYTNEGDSECLFLQLNEAANNPKWLVTYTYKSKAANLKRTVKYVHELQNLYYNLTGEELKIEMQLSS